VDAGIAALERDEPDVAVSKFRAELRRDPELAKKAFLSAYADRADAMVREDVAALCKPPALGSSQAWGGSKRPDLIEAALEMESDDERRAHLQLCGLMDSLPSSAADRDAATILDYLGTHSGDRSRWSAAESYWLGYRLLEATAKMQTPKEADLAVARELLMTGLRAEAMSQPKGGATSQAFGSLRALCKEQEQEQGTAVCVWNLVTLAEAVPELVGAGEIVDLVGDARAAVQSLTMRQVERLEQLAEVGVALVAKLPAQKRIWLAAYLEYTQIVLNLDRYAYVQTNSDALIARARAFRSRASTLGFPPEGPEFDILAMVLQYDGKRAEFEKLVAERKDAVGGDSHSFMIHLGKREIEKAAEQADLKLAQSGWRDPEWHFKSALMHLLLNDSSYEASVQRTFVYVRHQYRDYLRLMLWWRFMQQGRSDDAKALLQERLLEIPAEARVRERLEIGDLGPWRERLIRYFLEPENDAARAAVLAPMNSEQAFRQSDLVDAGQSYRTFRCERFFYDALLQAVTGPEDSAAARCEENLKAVRDEACFATYEYTMAALLLQRKECQVGRGPTND
jgi:hypothetical protein